MDNEKLPMFTGDITGDVDGYYRVPYDRGTLIPSANSSPRSGLSKAGFTVTDMPNVEVIEIATDDGVICYNWYRDSDVDKFDRVACAEYEHNLRHKQTSKATSKITKTRPTKDAKKPASKRSKEQVEPAVTEASDEFEPTVVHFHVPGFASIPVEFYEICLNIEGSAIALISDERTGSKNTKRLFNSNNDATIRLSVEDSDQIFDCKYFGQTCVVDGKWRVHFLVITDVSDE